MIRYFNNKFYVNHYINIWYEYSNARIFKWLLKKVFRVVIYNIHYFYTIEEITNLFENFSDNDVNKFVSDLCNNTDNEELLVTIEEEFM